MKVADYTALEKSHILAKLCGWVYKRRKVIGNSWWVDGEQIYYETHNGVSVKPLNLYVPENMALAWRVLNWATLEPTAQLAQIVKQLSIGGIMSVPPPQAQEIILDRILELALFYSMVDVALLKDMS